MIKSQQNFVHATTVPCTKFCSERLIKIWMIAKWNFHHIWIGTEIVNEMDPDLKWKPRYERNNDIMKYQDFRTIYVSYITMCVYCIPKRMHVVRAFLWISNSWFYPYLSELCGWYWALNRRLTNQGRVTYMRRQWNVSSMVQVMTCRLFGTKP